ncbi:hypothetical protein D1872_327120 [compost metagenome]
MIVDDRWHIRCRNVRCVILWFHQSVAGIGYGLLSKFVQVCLGHIFYAYVTFQSCSFNMKRDIRFIEL